MRYLIIPALLLLAACSQNPAPVSYKGDQFYGRNGGQNNGSRLGFDPSVRNAPEQGIAAPLDSVGVNSLSPIQSTDLPPPSNTPSQPSGKALLKPSSKSPFGPPSKPFGETTPAAQPIAAPAKIAAYEWPVKGEVVQRFGPSAAGKNHDGLTIMGKPGEAIKAAADGTVAYQGSDVKAYGNIMLLRHKDNVMTAYARAAKFTVAKGESVKRGQVIGYLSDSKPELYFGVRQGKTPVDPAGMLAQNFAAK